MLSVRWRTDFRRYASSTAARLDVQLCAVAGGRRAGALARAALDRCGVGGPSSRRWAGLVGPGTRSRTETETAPSRDALWRGPVRNRARSHANRTEELGLNASRTRPGVAGPALPFSHHDTEHRRGDDAQRENGVRQSRLGCRCHLASGYVGLRSNQMRQAARELAQRRNSAGLGARAPVTQLLQQLVGGCGPTGAGPAPKRTQFLSHRIDGLEEVCLARR
jgi:hypothetical protein